MNIENGFFEEEAMEMLEEYDEILWKYENVELSKTKFVDIIYRKVNFNDNI